MLSSARAAAPTAATSSFPAASTRCLLHTSSLAGSSFRGMACSGCQPHRRPGTPSAVSLWPAPIATAGCYPPTPAPAPRPSPAFLPSTSTSTSTRQQPHPRSLATARALPPSASSASASAAPPQPSPPAPSPAPQASPGPPHPTYTSGLGQVVASASTYVRVDVHRLLPDEAPTPRDWRPPHLAPQPSPSSPPSPSSTPSASTSPASPSASGEADQASPGPSSSGTDRLDSDAKPNLDLGPDLDPGSGQALAPPRQLLCSVRGLLRKLRQDVVVGDVVRLSSIDWAQGRGVVAEVLPRSSRLTDPAVANVDHVMLVFALANPPFEEIQVSRFLVAAEAAGLPFSLLLNKADLVPPEELQRRLGQCRAWGYEPIVLSCETGRGVEQVAEALQGRVSVVAGPSGAGKSSLINALRLGRHRPDLPPPPPEPELDSPSPAASDCDEDAGNLDLDSDSAATGSGSGSDRVAAAPSDPLELRLPPPGLRRRRRGGGGDPSAASSAGASTDGGGGSSGRATDADGSADPDTEADAEAGPGSGPGSEAEAEGEAAEWLAVGALSRIGRGMHTTTAVRLLRLAGGGWLADTPGFGQPTLDDLPSTSLAACFPEFMALTSASACRFADCLHVAEPGCAVSGQGVERYSHYLRLLQEIKTREASDLKAVQRAKAEREGYAKAKSVRGGGERLEARLDSKKHRRTSRAANKAAGRRGEDL